MMNLSQLKLVNEEVGPFKIEHDHEQGLSHLHERFD
jgi:hypothetical protein